MYGAHFAGGFSGFTSILCLSRIDPSFTLVPIRRNTLTQGNDNFFLKAFGEITNTKIGGGIKITTRQNGAKETNL